MTSPIRRTFFKASAAASLALPAINFAKPDSQKLKGGLNGCGGRGTGAANQGQNFRAVMRWATALVFVCASFAFDLAADEKPALEFYVISQEKIEGGRFINTKEFPKLGHITAKPGLKLGKLANAAIGDRDEKFPVLQITLLEKDARSLAAFTKRNVGNRIFLMIDDLPLLAPTVLEPIRTRTLQISISDKTRLQKLLPSLRRLVKPKR